MHITEGISGGYQFHLAKVDTNATGLCGAKTMNTQIPISAWGVRGHLNEKWCSKCGMMGADALRRAGVDIPFVEPVSSTN